MIRDFSCVFAIALCAMLPNAICAQDQLGDDANPQYAIQDDPNYVIQDELAILHEEIDKLKSAVNQKVRPGHLGETMQVVGRVHADIWGFPGREADIPALEGGPDSPLDRIGFRRLRFGVRGNLRSNMEYRLEMDFAGELRSEFRDAWLGWNNLPVLQTVRIGSQKRPIGLDHWNSSMHNVFMERPLIIDGNNEDARRLGIQSWNSSNDQRWSWQYGVFNRRNMRGEPYYKSNHWQLEGVGRLANTFWYDEASCGRGYGHWAVSGSWGDAGGRQIDLPITGPAVNEARWGTRPEARTNNFWLDTGPINGANDTQQIGVEGLLNVGPLQIVGEYQNVFVDRDAGQSELNFDGGYAYASFFLTGEHMVWDRTTNQLGRVVPHNDFFLARYCCGRVAGRGMGAWQIAVRGSYADYSDDDINGGIGKALTVGLNWYWTAYSRMQVNYIHGEIKDSWSLGPITTPGQPLRSGEYDIVGARFMIDF
jgi:phosphate-selective porin OprO/OprP